MKAGERFRVRFAFGLLGGVPVFLAGWLGWVQVAQAGELARDKRAPLRLVAATADRQFQRDELVPAPRGTIVDRNGSVLALDCEVYEVRADIRVPVGVELQPQGAARRHMRVHREVRRADGARQPGLGSQARLQLVGS